MSYSLNQSVNAAINRALALIGYNVHNDALKHYEFMRRTILADDSLAENEKPEAIRSLTESYDAYKIIINQGSKRICENCKQECFATLYCELCVRNYLKEKFVNWTSGNVDIDNLIQECQINSFKPIKIPEWIPYNNLQNIQYLTKGGCSEIYTADRVDGAYYKWDSKEKQLIRIGRQKVILKKLENVENANQSWFEEAKSHLILSNKWPCIVQCFGLTQDLTSGSYMLVMTKMNMDLRRYLQQNHNEMTWRKRIKIVTDIIIALNSIHRENAIHRDLHSGNVLLIFDQRFVISDLGFCGPAHKPLTSIYGNLPYIAPEVIIGKEQTFKSDVYSIAMLMWEISSGQPPFINYNHNYYFAMNIVNGMRPKIVPGTPLEYKSLMKQCWDADPSKRPDVVTLWKKINEINLHYQNKSNYLLTLLPVNNDNLEVMSSVENYTSTTSKLYHFDNFPEPKNATEEEQEVLHSKSYNFYIPNNIVDFDKLSNQKNNTSKITNMFKDVQNEDRRILMQQHINNHYIIVIDEDEVYNNPNLHSEDQDELELPDGN
ncbi:hypothetical protein RclHR1_03970003 [Rhizophagus clarus]|uniref:Protein kinase domain-containing protein n=1 Tax=Rhizophagus clarus TaxID=94130 RepID=A0A2Z6RFR0_9GLOM|nr:hypothetical protein RclHR1_03970003 [Rhizophagus clarus]